MMEQRKTLPDDPRECCRQVLAELGKLDEWSVTRLPEEFASLVKALYLPANTARQVLLAQKHWSPDAPLVRCSRSERLYLARAPESLCPPPSRGWSDAE